MANITKAVAVSLALLGSGSGLDALAQSPAIKGSFTVFSMAHTSNWPKATDVNPWDGKSNGNFLYRAASCSTANAPVNNASSDLPSYNARIPGGRVPSSTRVQDLRFTADSHSLSGTFDVTVCQLAPGPASDGRKDADREKIYFKFQAIQEVISTENATFRGRFKITGGTGRYSDLTGEGEIAGYFFCFNQEACNGSNSRYRDVQFSLQGTFSDPTGLK